MTENGHTLSPLGLTAADFAARWKAAGLRGGVEAGLAAYSRFYREGDLDFPPPVAVEIAPIVKRMEEPCDEGLTVKFCQRLDKKIGDSPSPRAADRLPLGILSRDDRVEHLDIETVIIPMIGRTRRKTHTMCISSQIGCAMGCEFCETAQMGLIRSLTPAEMVGQWWAARHMLSCQGRDAGPPDAGPPDAGKIDINNIVFMGMGEPLDNLDAVLEAIACLTDDRGPAVPMSNITISTVGRVDGLRRLAEVVKREGWKRLGLALSVNAPNDRVRDQIMPVNKRWDMAELREAMVELCRVRGNRKVLFEYVLIPGVNDSRQDALDLAEWLRPFTRNEHQSHIGLLNVIPYNPRRNSPWPAPDEARVKEFVDWLADAGVFAKRRRTKGRDQMAACGQLGTAEIRQRRFTPADHNA
jgi:23S rRNA (adenine2503-C2)-methyltransferase